jgi:hypothetical protein
MTDVTEPIGAVGTPRVHATYSSRVDELLKCGSAEGGSVAPN